MKKFKKLLSVLLAVLMILSTMSVMAFAHQDYGKKSEFEYNSNDRGNAMLFTDEQRASMLCDKVNDLLASANIYQVVKIIPGLWELTIDIRSLDALMKTIVDLKGLLNAAKNLNIDIGLLKDLNYDAIQIINVSTAPDVNGKNGGAVQMINALLAFLNANADKLGDVIGNGSFSVGVLNSALGAVVDTINGLVADLPDFIKENVYWLGHCHMPDGIGSDPANPNDAYWDDMDATAKSKWTIDYTLEMLIKDALCAPRWTENITDKSQNDIASNPEKYGIDSSYIHSESAVDEDGNPVYLEDGKTQATYYYIYGTQKSDGNWAFVQSGNEKNKHYIQHWDQDSILVPEADRTKVLEMIDFNGKSIYEIADKAILWAYDAYGAQNLDGQFRATLMQFTGAVNNALTNSAADEAIKEQLVAKMKSYTDTYKDPVSLAEALEKEEGIAGNRNFMYIALDGKNINESSDLYYVVEWYGWYEYYKVTFPAANENGKRGLFDLADWEYQIDKWATVSEGWTGGASVLKRINNIAGNILKDVIKDLNWSFDTAPNYNNANLETNLDNLIKQVIKTDPARFFGGDFDVPADFDSYTLEQVATMVAADLVNWLMPALVLPEKDAKDMCLEEVAVYAVREFIADIMPQYNWDAKITEANAKTGLEKDAAFLDILLNMGTSIGAYYLREVAGLGTTTDGNGHTTTKNVPMGPDTTWEVQLNFIVDEMINNWVPRLGSKVKANNPDAFASNDGLVKLTAIANSLAPGLLSLISGCSGTVGAKTYAVDLRVVKNLLAGALNGKLVPVAEKLYRNTAADCYANKAVIPAIIGLLKDFFGGLGCAGVNGWSDLTGPLDAALKPENAAAPLDSIITKANLKLVIQGLIKTLYSVKELWLQDGLALIMEITGATSDRSYNGVSMYTDKGSYYGAASASVIPTVTLNIKGIPVVYYDGGYKTGDAKFAAGDYSGTVTKVAVEDMSGKEVAQRTESTALNPNASVQLNALSVPVENDAKMYRMKVYVTVTTPYEKADGTGYITMDVVATSTFVACAQDTGDEDTSKTSSFNPGDLDVSGYNHAIYIDENTPLTAAEGYTIQMHNTQGLNSYAEKSWFIDKFGKVEKQADGSVALTGYTNGAANWNVRKNGGAAANLQANDASIPFFWNWQYETAGKEWGGYGLVSYDQWITRSMWVVDETAKTRADFEDDFTRFTFTSDNWRQGYYKLGWGYKWTSDAKIGYIKPLTIMLYNSYGIKGAIDSAVNSGRVAADYTSDSWTTYVNALDAAVKAYYNPRNIDDFDTNSMATGTSIFKTVSENLEVAIKGLVPVSGEGAYTSTEMEAFAALKADLDDEDKLDNRDFIMYRWLKYYNEMAYLSDVYNSTIIPSGIADSKLAGVPADKIADVTAAADAKFTSLIKDKLTVGPTTEESEAAAQERADFLKNLPKINLAEMYIDREQMKEYRGRLIAKEAKADHHYLDDAVSVVTGRVAVNDTNKALYTDATWEAYKLAYDKAVAVQGNEAAKTSEVFNARYGLLCAYKSLVLKAEMPDYTALDAALAEADKIFADMDNAKLAADSKYTDVKDALANLLAEVGHKVVLNAGTEDEETYFIGGDHTGASAVAQRETLKAENSQDWIDSVTADIEAALAEFATANPSLVPIDETGNGGVVDTTDGRNYLYGIAPNQPIEQVFKGIDGGHLSITGAVGTGTTVQLLEDGTDKVLATYTAVIFGDVNGDALVNGIDAGLIKQDVAKVTPMNNLQKFASDVNADNLSNGIDAGLIKQDVAKVQSIPVNPHAKA